ncbi:hypothetical protein IJG27_04600 [Candidatus Saccharibacteria bacterium]|nr:hypothetical protein [Candidatus Saccharibacteria bacterium]MBQ6461196.1 hypothetical protein [Candidatus Saccharibacteria bacterium]
MKTKVSFITLKDVQDGREDILHIRIRTSHEEMMTNRVIQLFSQYPRERLVYGPQLELEIVEGYVRSFCAGFSLLLIMQEIDTAREFTDAVYGCAERNIDDTYLIFVRWMRKNLRAYIANWLRYKTFSISDLAIKLLDKAYKDPGIDEGDTQSLMKDLLKARRRINRFIVRHADEAERCFVPFD